MESRLVRRNSLLENGFGSSIVRVQFPICHDESGVFGQTVVKFALSSMESPEDETVEETASEVARSEMRIDTPFDSPPRKRRTEQRNDVEVEGGFRADDDVRDAPVSARVNDEVIVRVNAVDGDAKIPKDECRDGNGTIVDVGAVVRIFVDVRPAWWDAQELPQADDEIYMASGEENSQKHLEEIRRRQFDRPLREVGRKLDVIKESTGV